MDWCRKHFYEYLFVDLSLASSRCGNNEVSFAAPVNLEQHFQTLFDREMHQIAKLVDNCYLKQRNCRLFRTRAAEDLAATFAGPAIDSRKMTKFYLTNIHNCRHRSHLTTL